MDQNNGRDKNSNIAPATLASTHSSGSPITVMDAAELKSFLEIIKENDCKLIKLANERGDLDAWRNALALIRKARELS